MAITVAQSNAVRKSLATQSANSTNRTAKVICADNRARDSIGGIVPLGSQNSLPLIDQTNSGLASLVSPHAKFVGDKRSNASVEITVGSDRGFAMSRKMLAKR
jgi:hypothetical protein